MPFFLRVGLSFLVCFLWFVCFLHSWVYWYFVFEGSTGLCAPPPGSRSRFSRLVHCNRRYNYSPNNLGCNCYPNNWVWGWGNCLLHIPPLNRMRIIWLRCLISGLPCLVSWLRCYISWLRCLISWLRCLLGDRIHLDGWCRCSL